MGSLIKVEYKEYPSGAWTDWTEYLTDIGGINQLVESENPGEAGVIVFDNCKLSFVYESGNEVHNALSGDLTSTQRFLFRISCRKSNGTFKQQVEMMLDVGSIEEPDLANEIEFTAMDKLTALGILEEQLIRTVVSDIQTRLNLGAGYLVEFFYGSSQPIDPDEHYVSLRILNSSGENIDPPTGAFNRGEVIRFYPEVGQEEYLLIKNSATFTTSPGSLGNGYINLVFYCSYDIPQSDYSFYYLYYEPSAINSPVYSKELYGVDCLNYVSSIPKSYNAKLIIEAIWSAYWAGESIVDKTGGEDINLPLQYFSQLIFSNPLGKSPLDFIKMIADTTLINGLPGLYIFINKAGSLVLFARGKLGSQGTNRTITSKIVKSRKTRVWDKIADGVEITVRSWLKDDTNNEITGFASITKSIPGSSVAITPKNPIKKEVFCDDQTVTTETELNTIASNIATAYLDFYGKQHSKFTVELTVNDDVLDWELCDYSTYKSTACFSPNMNLDPIGSPSRTTSLEFVEIEGHEFDIRQIVFPLSADKRSSSLGSTSSGSGSTTVLNGVSYTFNDPLKLNVSNVSLSISDNLKITGSALDTVQGIKETDSLTFAAVTANGIIKSKSSGYNTHYQIDRTADANINNVWNITVSYSGTEDFLRIINIGETSHTFDFYDTGKIKVDGNLVWHAGNHGDGSGLDADLWDGNQFSSYLNQAVKTSSAVTFSSVSASSYISGGGTVIKAWTAADTDIDSLLPGSSFGSLIEGVANGHVVVGIQGNDGNDGFYVIDNNNVIEPTTYTQVVLQLTNTYFKYKGNQIWHSGNDGYTSTLVAGDSKLWEGNEFGNYLNQAVRIGDSPTFNNITFSGVITQNGTGNNLFAGNLQTSNYASQLTGWRITKDGQADFRYLFANEMHVKSFIADMEQAIAGAEIITKSVAILAEDFTMPAYQSSVNIKVESFEGYPSFKVFEDGDTVRIRQFSRSGSSTTVSDGWGTVTWISTDTTNKTQTYQLTGLDTGSASGTIEKGTLVLDYGTNGYGFIESTTIDGAAGVNSPYIRLGAFSTANGEVTLTETARFGKLDGLGISGLAGLGLHMTKGLIKIGNTAQIGDFVYSAPSPTFQNSIASLYLFNGKSPMDATDLGASGWHITSEMPDGVPGTLAVTAGNLIWTMNATTTGAPDYFNNLIEHLTHKIYNHDRLVGRDAKLKLEVVFSDNGTDPFMEFDFSVRVDGRNSGGVLIYSQVIHSEFVAGASIHEIQEEVEFAIPDIPNLEDLYIIFFADGQETAADPPIADFYEIEIQTYQKVYTQISDDVAEFYNSNNNFIRFDGSGFAAALRKLKVGGFPLVRYLGEQSSDPADDVLIGDEFYNTTSSVFKKCTGYNTSGVPQWTTI
ncbi:MAG: hypothetical protein K9I99_03790 [Melioribacteraceae bacterium]|nr:hypothetical protein [Melioribacteraceae bacterium]